MKKLYYTGIIFLILHILFLFSCSYPMEEKIDGIEIRIPTRQIYTRPGDYFAQVYLLIDKELFPLGNGTDYIEKTLNKQEDQNRVVVEDVPAGRYVLWLGIGTKRTENGAFNVQYYYESEEFELVAGSTASIYAELLDCPFDKALNILGENINGAVIYTIGAGSPTLYASGPKNIYSFSGNYNGPDFDVSEVFNESDFPNYSINSVSKGLDYTGGIPPDNCLFISTTTGISKTDLNTVDNTFSSGLGQMNIPKSLAYPDDANVAVFFQRDGGMGGVYHDDQPMEWVYVDYSEMLKDQLVWDFCVTNNLKNIAPGQDNCGYFATALGALRIPQEFIEDYEEGDDVNFMTLGQFFEILDDNDEEIPIVSLGYDPDTATPENSTLYMGTFEGLYYAQVGTATPLNGTPELLEETEGTRIYMVLLNDAYRIYVSQTYLFLQEKSSDDVVSLPFVAGIPGAVSALDWDGNTLVISGTLGVVTLDVDTMF